MPNTPRRPPAQQPRPRMSLRSAMRLLGLDEHRIARVLKRQVNRFQRLVPKKKLSIAHEKLLLEILKECAKIIDPTTRGGAASEVPATVVLNHQIPRPDRSQAASNGHSADTSPEIER
jgi:hypothetical protein